MENEKIHIVFDTSYLKSINYNYNSSIFKKIKNNNLYKLYISQIVDSEMHASMLESALEVRSYINKTPYCLREELLNINFYEPRQILEDINSILEDQYDLFITEADVKIIKNDKECTDELWERYFSKKPPFSKNKKLEFPDATALLSIVRYFENKKIDKTSIIIVSSDEDWKSFCSSKEICIVKDNKGLILEIDKRLPPLKESIISEVLKQSKETIEGKIKSQLEEIELEGIHELGLIDAEEVDREIDINNYNIISLTDKEVNLLYNVKYSVEISGLEEDSWLSTEDGIIFLESASIVAKSNIEVEVNIHFDLSIDYSKEEYYIEEDVIDIIVPTVLNILSGDMEYISEGIED